MVNLKKNVLYHNKLRDLIKARELTQRQIDTILRLHCEDRLSHRENGKATLNVEEFMKLRGIYKIFLVDIYEKSTEFLKL